MTHLTHENEVLTTYGREAVRALRRAARTGFTQYFPINGLKGRIQPCGCITLLETNRNLRINTNANMWDNIMLCPTHDQKEK